MTYKWYKKLTRDEVYERSWFSILAPHGFTRGQSIKEFAPELEIINSLPWERYENWWNKHFNTKLNKLLTEVDDVY